MTSGVNAIAQKAAAAALSNGTEIISNRKKILQNRRDLIVSLLKQIPNVQFIIPKGSFYIFPIFNSYIGKKFNGQTISSTTELSMFLLEHALVATVAGEAFGFPGALRLSFAIDEKIISTAMQRIKKALSMLT
jgi:aspartate aminotransferase